MREKTASDLEKMDRKRSANGHIKPLSLSSSTEEMLCDDTKDKKEESKSEFDLDLSEEESESSLQLGTPSDMLSDHAPIYFNDNAHIQHVKFLSKTSANTLEGNKTRLSEHFPLEDWCHIPALAVLTGINGSGKSTILKYLSEITGCSGNQSIDNTNKVLYLSADAIPFSNHYYSNQQHYDYLTDDNRFDFLIAACENYLDTEQLQDGTADQNKKLIENICGRYNKTKEEKPMSSRRELLKLIAREIIPTNPASMKDPFQYLTEAMLMHCERIRGWKDRLRNVKNIRFLHQYYRDTINDSISLDSFVTQLEEQNEKFYSKLLDDAAKHYSGFSALEVVNEVLRKYQFKYQLVSHQDSQDSRKNELKLKAIDDSLEYDITTAELSSGERMILTMMSWLYFKEDTQKRLAAGETEEKIKILLLDEPDRHLDPKLCKLFFSILQEEFVKKHKIQVIMSTHRFDSIVYAERNSIFIVQKVRDRRQIVSSSRMEAIFRMTSNIRELTAYERRVYTESTSDAQFYQGVYLTLARWFEKNNEEGWYPSRRHQLSFHAVSKPRDAKSSAKGEGGSQKVIDSVQKDNYHANISEKKESLSNRYTLFKLINEPGLLKSFGILDRDYDYDGTVKRLESKQILDSVVILKRHSLENFCLDPIVFCSTLENIDEYIETINLIKRSYEHVKTTFKSIFQNIKGLLEQDLTDENVIRNLQVQITAYFFVLLPIVAMKIWFDSKSKEEDKKRCFSICQTSRLVSGDISWESLQKDSKSLGKRFLATFGDPAWFNEYLNSQNTGYKWTEINIISKPKEKLIKFSLQYPNIFLELRGHTIEGIFNTNPLPSDDIIWAVYDKGLRFVPEDLTASFVELDAKIRGNVHQATKPHSGRCPVILKRGMSDSQDPLSLHCLDIHSPSSPCSSSYFPQSKKRKVEGVNIPSAGNQPGKCT